MSTPIQPRTLADLRKVTGMTSEQVGERMGVNGARVRHIEAKYPKINYDTLLRYISALGGDVRLIVGTTHASADQLEPDPAMRGTRKYLNEKAGAQRIRDASTAAKELPLQRNAAQPGSDDPGGQVDQADTQRDESDSDQGE